MSVWRSRLHALEARQRRRHPPAPAYFTSIVRVPKNMLREDWGAWLAEQPCACGVVRCPDRRIGLLLPTPCDTVEEWEALYGREGPHEA